MKLLKLILSLLTLLSIGTRATYAQISPFDIADDPLSPSDIIILANSNARESVDLAKYYAGKRAIPEKNIIALPMPADETITYGMYVMYIYNPLHKWLVDNRFLAETLPSTDAFGRIHGHVVSNSIGYIVICQGVPLRIQDDDSFNNDANKLAFARAVTPRGNVQSISNGLLLHSFACVDSEIAAMAADMNPVLGFIQNPMYRKAVTNNIDKLRIIKTSRLGGSSYTAARSLVDSAIEGEKNGLSGRVYIDKGGPYALANQWLDDIADAFAKRDWDVEVEATKNTFGADARFDAPAIYFGWYTTYANGPFVEPGMRFPPGAIAMHLHSFSATSLASKTQWTSAIVDRGAAGTIGNVYEPTLSLTHDFKIIAQAIFGGWTFCDAAWASMPALSWQGVILGDPLYRPLPKPTCGALCDDFIPADEYGAVRAVIKLENAGNKSAALAKAREYDKKFQGYVTALKLAELLHASIDDDGARAALKRFVNTDAKLSCYERSEAIEAARLLDSLGDFEGALSILANLRVQKTSSAFQAAVFDLGCAIAQKSGNAAHIEKWHKPPATPATAPALNTTPATAATPAKTN
jgi:uncharacterized protein (TIGR03790 family)